MSLVERISNRIEELTKPSDRFLLAVSGGKDSMVLLEVFNKLQLNFVVAHMNYGLRPIDADLDERLVREYTEAKAIPFFSKKVNAKSFCEEEGYATQEGARILRYRWFNELLEEEGLDWIVTAHHEEDNKETFIQNLKRGSGLRGLKAMKVMHENKLKPMLDLSKSEIEKFASQNKVSFRQDASNNQNHYQRNLIRNQVLPTIENDLPGFGKGITSSIEKLQIDYHYLIDRLNRDAEELLIKENDGWKIKEYKKVHARLLFHVLEKFEFNASQVEDILRSNSSGKKIENAKYTVQDGYGDLYIFTNDTPTEEEQILPEMGTYRIGDIKLIIAECDFPKAFSSEKNVAYLDADKLSWPLKVTNYRHGDKIIPIGMRGSKKISDYFTDEKIPVHQRAQKKVIRSGDEIVWLVGELMSDKYKLTTSTKKVLKFETF